MAHTWLLFLPVALGLLAVYWLLPRARGYPLLWGAAAGGLALVLAGILLIRAGGLHPETVLFYAFAGIAVVAGGLLVTQRNPVHAALSFALVVLSTCGLFLLQAAPFLMAATVIVYAGAIVVTFLFVIMLAQQEGMSDADHRSREPLLSVIAGFVLLGTLLYLLDHTYDVSALSALLKNAEQAGERVEVMRKARPAGQATRDQVTAEVGDLEGALGDFQKDGLKKVNAPADDKRALDAALLQARLVLGPQSVDLAKLRDALARVRDTGERVRDTYGSLQPQSVRDGVPVFPVSEFSWPQESHPHKLRRDRDRRAAMPAENVAALGRSLFTDYLLPVELGGTLLLVATIGAIAIAGRRPEGRR